MHHTPLVVNPGPRNHLRCLSPSPAHLVQVQVHHSPSRTHSHASLPLLPPPSPDPSPSQQPTASFLVLPLTHFHPFSTQNQGHYKSKTDQILPLKALTFWGFHCPKNETVPPFHCQGDSQVSPPLWPSLYSVSMHSFPFALDECSSNDLW